MEEKRRLLAFVLNQPIASTYLSPQLNAEQQKRYEELCARLETGEPLAYVMGSAEFWSLHLKVTPEVLIPRPETELLVDITLSSFAAHRKIKALELGTGSAAIAIALKKERPNWEIVAVDKSVAALNIAKYNAEQYQTPIQFFESDWFNVFENQKFDLILSNPPYIAEGDPHLKGSIRFEPELALKSGLDGLKDLARIIKTAPQFLNPQGYLLLEHGYDQGEVVQELLLQNGYHSIKRFKDVFGNERAVRAKASVAFFQY